MIASDILEVTGLAGAWRMFSGTHQAHMMIGSPPYGWAPNR